MTAQVSLFIANARLMSVLRDISDQFLAQFHYEGIQRKEFKSGQRVLDLAYRSVLNKETRVFFESAKTKLA